MLLAREKRENRRVLSIRFTFYSSIIPQNSSFSTLVLLDEVATTTKKISENGQKFNECEPNLTILATDCPYFATPAHYGWTWETGGAATGGEQIAADNKRAASRQPFVRLYKNIMNHRPMATGID